MNGIDRPTRTPWTWPAAIAALVLLLALSALVPGLGSWGLAMIAVVVLIAAALVGWAFITARRERLEFERRIEVWARDRAIESERLRIARDLHDLASHGLGLITVRASTASLADDAERRAALVDIERLGREATSELRQMLTVLRSTSAEPTAPLAPADRLDDLPAILDEARLTGLGIEFVSDEFSGLPRDIELTVCAVIREGLNNTIRHAGPTTIRIRLVATEHTIVVDMRDEGVVPGWVPHRGAGCGLAGLRERVELRGGTLNIGAVDDGFRVLAAIPLEDH